jgi:hypothetical protein
MGCCHDSACSSAARPDALNSPRWRRALWIALAINAGFFVAEIVAGAAAGSAALQADALDFFGDAANYAISLGVAGTCARSGFARAMMLSAMRRCCSRPWEFSALGQAGRMLLSPRPWAALACGADGKSSLRRAVNFAPNALRLSLWRRNKCHDWT